MNLQRFLPYRISILSEAVSQCVAQVYRERFGLARDEWRILATLADARQLSTAAVIERTALEKMQVSRAVARLERDGLIERFADPGDRRSRLLRLLPAGRALHAKVVPMVQARERFLLEALEPEQRQLLDIAIDRLVERARRLREQG